MIKDIKVKTNEEILNEVLKIQDTREEQYGNDGILEIGRKTYEYKKIKYDIAIIQYYTIRPVSLDRRIYSRNDRMHSLHAVVESPKETEPLVELVSFLESSSNFLYNDTMGSSYDKMTIRRQVDECHIIARDDIDNLLEIVNISKKNIEQIKIKIEELQKYIIKE